MPEKVKHCCKRFETEMEVSSYIKYSYIHDGKGKVVELIEKDAQGKWQRIPSCPFCGKRV